MLAVDLGVARIGLAVTDEERRLASPLGVVRAVGARKDAAAIRKCLGDRKVALLVVGLPLSDSDEEEGPSAQRARARGLDLAHRLNLPVEFVDETMSTKEALDALIASGASKRRRRDDIDAVAAALILERWMRGSESGARK